MTVPPVVFQPPGTARPPRPQAQVLRRRGRAVAGDAAGAVGAGGETATEAAQVGQSFEEFPAKSQVNVCFFPLKPGVFKSILLDLSVFCLFLK